MKAIKTMSQLPIELVDERWESRDLTLLIAARDVG
jgi:hypothetical protein